MSKNITPMMRGMAMPSWGSSAEKLGESYYKRGTYSSVTGSSTPESKAGSNRQGSKGTKKGHRY